MRISLNPLLFYFIGSAFLFNLYLFYQLLVRQEYSNNYFNTKYELNLTQKNHNEFIVLDWTALRHVFKEEDPIKCKFILSLILSN
jgi:hypothetical protein